MRHWRSAVLSDLWIAVPSTLIAAGAAAISVLELAPALACPIRCLVGLPCLSCGATRAAYALAQGDLSAALQLNPLAAAGMVAAATGGLLAVPWVMARGPVPARLDRIPLLARLALAALLLGNWLYLLLASRV